jgi:hypothetical protein
VWLCVRLCVCLFVECEHTVVMDEQFDGRQHGAQCGCEPAVLDDDLARAGVPFDVVGFDLNTHAHTCTT